MDQCKIPHCYCMLEVGTFIVTRMPNFHHLLVVGRIVVDPNGDKGTQLKWEQKVGCQHCLSLVSSATDMKASIWVEVPTLKVDSKIWRVMQAYSKIKVCSLQRWVSNCSLFCCMGRRRSRTLVRFQLDLRLQTTVEELALALLDQKESSSSIANHMISYLHYEWKHDSRTRGGTSWAWSSTWGSCAQRTRSLDSTCKLSRVQAETSNLDNAT